MKRFADWREAQVEKSDAKKAADTPPAPPQRERPSARAAQQVIEPEVNNYAVAQSQAREAVSSLSGVSQSTANYIPPSPQSGKALCAPCRF